MKAKVPVLFVTIFTAAVLWFANAAPVYGQLDPVNLMASIESVNQVFEDFGEKDGKVIDEILDNLESQGSEQGEQGVKSADS